MKREFLIIRGTKLTAQQAREIYELRYHSLPAREVGEWYDITAAMVYQIWKGIAWKTIHLKTA